LENRDEYKTKNYGFGIISRDKKSLQRNSIMVKAMNNGSFTGVLLKISSTFLKKDSIIAYPNLQEPLD